MTKLIHYAVIFGLVGVCFSVGAAAEDDLTELSLEKLMEVPIIGASKYQQKQSEVAAAVSVITRDEIKAFGWRTLAEALNSLPGVYITYDRQYAYLGLRGFSIPGDYNTRILVTINGNRLNEVVYDAVLLEDGFPLPLNLIERIEFIPGPGGAVYGQNAMFGVVNIITRKGIGVDGGELGISWQSPQNLHQGRVTWGKLLDNGMDVLLSASAQQAQGEDRFFDYPGTNIAGIAAGMDGFYNYSLLGRLTRGPWDINLIYHDRRKDDPTAAFFATPLVSGQYQRDYGYKLQLTYQTSLPDNNLDILGRFYVGSGDYESHYTDADVQYLEIGKGSWVGGETRLVYNGINHHKLMLGMEVQDNYQIDQGSDDLSTSGTEVFIPITEQRFGLYVQDEWHFTETLSTTLGLRVDKNNATPGTQASPRLALIWQTTPQTTLKAMYGRAYRAPNAFERNYDDGGHFQIANGNLRGETIDTMELTMDYRVHSDLNVRAALYHWDMKDIITLTEVTPAMTQYQAGPQIKANGLELSGAKTWENGARARTSITYQQVNYFTGDELINSPRWLGRFNLSSPLPWMGLRLGYELQYDAKRLSEDGWYLNGYLLSNLILTTNNLAKDLELSLGIYNLFDKDYSHPASDINYQNSLEQDGRSLRLRAIYLF